MPPLDILLLGTPANRGATLDHAADEPSDQPGQGRDFASVMQAAQAPQNQTAPSKFSPRLGIKPDTASRPSLPANGAGTPSAANASQSDLSVGSKGSGSTAGTKDKPAAVMGDASPSVSSAPAASVEMLAPAFLSLPLFVTGLVPPPATSAPKAAANGNGSNPTPVLTGNSLNAAAPTTSNPLPANPLLPQSIPGNAAAPVSRSLADQLSAPGNGSNTTAPQARGNAQPIVNGLTIPVATGSGGELTNNAAIPAAMNASLPLGQAASLVPSSMPATVDLSRMNMSAVASLPQTIQPAAPFQPADPAPLSPGFAVSSLPAASSSPQPAENTPGQNAAVSSTNVQLPKPEAQKLPSVALEVSSSTAALVAQPAHQSTSQVDSQTASQTPVPMTTATPNSSFGASLPAGGGPGLPGTLSPGQALQNDGTGVAISDSLMKTLQKTNKVAGSDVKVLPVGQNGQASENNLPELPAGPARAADNRSTDLNFTFSNGSSQPSASETAPVQGSADLSSLSDTRLRTIDRAHDMMALHSMRLVESKSDALSVVIKPAVGTELSLELRQNGTEIQAHATLTRGDHQLLSQHWSELQQRLEQRGVKLAPLGNEAGSSMNDNSQFRQQQASQEEAAQQASAFAEFASVASPSGGATARLVPVHDGWESWA